MKTQYEKKVEEIKNRPCLLLFREEGGLLNEKPLKSTRESTELHYKVIQQMCQRGELVGL